jgi:hypothetical protein
MKENPKPVKVGKMGMFKLHPAIAVAMDILKVNVNMATGRHCLIIFLNADSILNCLKPSPR